jgi:hypothetical protein
MNQRDHHDDGQQAAYKEATEKNRSIQRIPTRAIAKQRKSLPTKLTTT